MKFCCDCFKDSEIRNIIESINNKDTCDIFNKQSDHIYDTEKHDSLIHNFEALLDVYTPFCNTKFSNDESKAVKIKNDILERWDIFSNKCNAENVYEIIKSICAKKYTENPELFDDNVIIEELFNDGCKQECSLLRNNSWDDFRENIIYHNRFHTTFFNTSVFKKFCLAIPKKYKKGSILYRGRISEKEGFPLDKMGCPEPKDSKDGRANAAGIKCLYLSSDADTAIKEVRAGVADYITIASFELNEDIWVVDLKMIDEISPFFLMDRQMSFVDYILNKEHLRKINNEMSKIVRKSDSKLDYVPTQYICDFIKSITIEENGSEIKIFKGVEYNSTLNKSGYNLAIFEPSVFKAISTEIYEVTFLKYKTDKLCKS